MFVTNQKCGHCGKQVLLQALELREYGKVEGRNVNEAFRIYQLTTQSRDAVQRSKTITGTPRDTNQIMDEMVDVAGTTFCPECTKPSLITFSCTRQALINHLSQLVTQTKLVDPLIVEDDEINIIPKLPAAYDHESWPEEIRREFRDIQDFVTEKRSPSLIISGCRTIIDVSAKKLEGEGKNIASRIDDLREKSVITQAIADWAHHIRVLGADATHDAGGTDEEAAELVAFLREFLNIAFTIPADIQQKKLSQ